MAPERHDKKQPFSLKSIVIYIIHSLKWSSTSSLCDSASLSQAKSSSSQSASHDSSDDSGPSRPCSSPIPIRSSVENLGKCGSSSPEGGMFTGAHHLSFSNCTFKDIHLVQPPLNHVLERLGQYSFSESPPDLTEGSPSQCHPNTRRLIIEKARTFHLPLRHKNLLWISGPAGTGKTAIMRSVAELERKRLAAKIFFSRANGRTDLRFFIRTIVYQLAVLLPKYQQYLMDRFTTDPRLLDKDVKELFKLLVEIPFGYRMSGEETEPWLILIDGLDECGGGERIQCEIVEMIGTFAQQYPTSPFVWVLASRPEWWLKAAFSRFGSGYYQEHLVIDSPEARHDVEIYLRSRFKQIRSTYSDQFSPDQVWPSESQITDLTKPASGLFLYASTASRFIEDPVIGNPIRQFSVLLSTIESPGTPTPGKNPLSPLHDLYLHILGSISPLAYQITRRVLGCCKLLPRNTIHSTSFMLSCNFLGISQHDAYASVQRLHSVLDIPSPAQAATKEIRVLHTSFSDFLENQAVARDYHVGRRNTGADIVRCSFRVLQEANQVDGPFPESSRITLTWPYDPEKTRDALLTTAYDGFRLLTVLENDAGTQLISLLANADFSKLDNYSPPSMKTSVHKTRGGRTSLFEWLVDKWKSAPVAVKQLVPIKEVYLRTTSTRSIRGDRSIVHLQFTSSGRGDIVVRPKVYSGCEKIRQKYRGGDMQDFLAIFRARQRELPNLKVQVWGRESAKTCLLFQHEPEAMLHDEVNHTVKEIFFIPYSPVK